jgi:hypothetical protein
MGVTALTTLDQRMVGRLGLHHPANTPAKSDKSQKGVCKTLNDGILPVWHEYQAVGKIRADTMANLSGILTIRSSNGSSNQDVENADHPVQADHPNHIIGQVV